MSPLRKSRVGILISGRGSNMDALIAAARDPAYPAEIALVIANRDDAVGIDKARAAGIATTIVPHRAHPTRDAFEAAMDAVLLANGVDLLCNAGFMRVLTPAFVDRWRDRHLNIHPSLLPAFKGLETHERVLAAGVRITGATVHVVRADVDAGPIIAQAAVPVLPGDTPATLATRVLAAEHQLYPHALALFASGRARVVGEHVEFSGPTPEPPAALLSVP
jgi:phosphoribosylglycinamide formyltransferase 1